MSCCFWRGGGIRKSMFANMGEGGGQKWPKIADVFYGRPLSTISIFGFFGQKSDENYAKNNTDLTKSVQIC